MRSHPLSAGGNNFCVFDPMTNSGVFPLTIVNGLVSNETITFEGKTAEIDHKITEMLHSMNKKGSLSQRSTEETSILDCSAVFNEEPFNIVKRIDDFKGFVKVDFKTNKIYLYRELDEPVSVQWNTKNTDKFSFRNDGRHPNSSHKIFSEIFNHGGFMFSEIFSHESNMTISVQNFSKGIIADLAMNTFVGDPGKKFHRGIKMVQDMATYVFPYIWPQGSPLLKTQMGTGHKYQKIEFVSTNMRSWSTNFAGEDEIDSPIILNVRRGRGRNHTDNVTVSITHQQVELVEE
jgi:hypothetical protein